MTRMQVQFKADQAAALRAQADAVGRPVAAIVREAVDAWLAGRERDRVWARALSAIGAGHSGLGDLAEEHDKYLSEGPRW